MTYNTTYGNEQNIHGGTNMWQGQWHHMTMTYENNRKNLDFFKKAIK